MSGGPPVPPANEPDRSERKAVNDEQRRHLAALARKVMEENLAMVPTADRPSEAGSTERNEVRLLTAEEGAEALREDLLERRRIFDEAMELPPYAVQLGASNMPHDCTIWATDWRERLPEGHPDRVAAEAANDMNTPGSEGARRATHSAHIALLAAARLAGKAGP
jgi:hypothetical protein